MQEGTQKILYRTAGKALPPRPIRLDIPGWAGSAEKKMEHGSQPQPWHCRPFVQAATYGVELIYHYEVECHVINEGGNLRIEWDYAKEPGGVLGIDEFGFTEPRPPQFYTFTTWVDLQAPPGHVLQTQPHPRYFTDTTGTVPLAIIGQVESEWWPKKLFVVFKVPPPGARHIFRKGEPYVQIVFIPARPTTVVEKMDPATEAQRQELEVGIQFARTRIAKNVWLNPQGGQFDDHYKVLSRAFAGEGAPAVQATVQNTLEEQRRVVQSGLTFEQYLDLARKYQREGRMLDARDVYTFLRTIERNNPKVLSGMGEVASALGLFDLAVQMISAAVAGEPRSADYRAQLGTALLQLGRENEAAEALRIARELGGASEQPRTSLRSIREAATAQTT